MHHTLNRKELREIISVKCLKLTTFDEETLYLNDFFNDSLSWDRKLLSLNHLLSIILEQFDKKGIEHQLVIEYIYRLQEECHFEVQEGDIRFIDSLYTNDCGSSLDLEEELITAQNRLEK